MPQTRTITVGGRTYALKEIVPLRLYRQWAECNPMDLESGLAGLNAVLAEPLADEDVDALPAEDYFGLHKAVFAFFLALRWEPSAPSAS